jgi:NADPH-dependent F420 reductase
VVAVTVGIVGGTGPAGRSLGARLASAGVDVVLGSRSAERAAEVRDEVVARWPGRGLVVGAGDNTDAAAADLVVVATPWASAAATAGELAVLLEGKVVISMANAIAKVGDELQPVIPPRGSVAAGVQAALPDSRVVAALHHVPARELGDLDQPVTGDVLVCSDHPDATSVVLDVLGRIEGMRVLDAGGLSSAAAIEAFTAVLLSLNRRYRTRVGVRFTGLDGWGGEEAAR